MSEYRRLGRPVEPWPPEWEPCEHCESDHSLAVAVIGESDSFGPLCRFPVCQACLDAADEIPEYRCRDCGKEFSRAGGLKN